MVYNYTIKLVYAFTSTKPEIMSLCSLFSNNKCGIYSNDLKH